MKQKVALLLEKALEENPSLFLISLSVTGDNQIKVVIDGDQGVSVQDCIEVSRAIEHNLDRDAEDFSLEVLSAGVSEPLTMLRQYHKNIGRDLKVKTTKETFEGRLVEALDEGAKLNWKAKELKPTGKGKITVEKEVIVPYQDIIEAKVMIKF